MPCRLPRLRGPAGADRCRLAPPQHDRRSCCTRTGGRAHGIGRFPRHVHTHLGAYYVDIGGKLLDYAIASGNDRDRGGLYWRINDKGNVTRTKIWWLQSEFLRAALRYEVAHDRADLRAVYDQTLAFVRAEFLDQDNGGWTPRPRPECLKDACKHQADVGYHIVAMHVDALRLSELQARRR